MKERYEFTQNEIETIRSRFGNDFYEKVLSVIQTYSDKWELNDFQLIPSYSANLVVRCHSAHFGSAVLKIGNPASISTEYETLSQYKGRRFCKGHDVDVENGVILEECVRPGTSLRDEASLHKRLTVFSSLYNGLHIEPKKTDIYPTYTGWVSRITDYMSKREDCPEMYLHMRKAKDICLAVASLYSQKMLLHGDFHHDNILLSGHDIYKIIDPKGVIGDPVFDVPRFILNEFEDAKTQELHEKIIEIISILAKSLHIPKQILKQCLYVETAMGVCWSVEDGATPEEYAQLVTNAAFAEAIMHTAF
ncbi:aminoglycoside phosphotransferase family protein [Paenibacillus aestuarii]|uniref:Aminoglycoside phosphotransferase family protein n=1 Tax=Paenibacillus aestuarii TaxID=516965 RepID=A0ABW0KD50_9BACL|nr:aminoglycoside phosphotransferase family protein [Paenibacillus aestuarii]